MSLADIQAADRRLIILASLEAANGYQLNDSVLLRTIEASTAPVSTDRLRAELEWLEEQGLVNTVKGTTTWLASVTERGADVALGRTSVSGVDRPRPGGY